MRRSSPRCTTKPESLTALVVALAVVVPLGAAANAHATTATGSGPGATGGGATPDAGATPSPPLSPTLRARLRRLVRGIGGASGAYVYDISAGRPLAALNAGKKRILASNTKLFTTAAEFGKYGPQGRFRTTLYTDGTVNAGVVDGNLFVRGGGDPLFGSDAYVGRRYGTTATVEQLAGRVALAGITQVTGRVYGDETALDTARGTAKYGFRRSGEIGGQLSALVFDRGLSSSGKSWQADMPRFVAAKLRSALEDAGVTVGSGVGVRATPATATTVSFVESPPLSRIVALTNKPSDNYLAEMLLKDLALGSAPGSAPGTTAAGAAAARRFAATLHSRVSLSDGSGLSRFDRAAPREVVDLLRGMQLRPDFTQYYASLSVPGVDGTLSKRMRGTAASKNCAAKTGTLSNVSALSGYCTTADGHLAAFSILQNGVWPSGAHAVQNRIVTALASTP
jgi:D-alanyl-D-alanine carboxypeptidase/D-alanyl-D-alanine-endopeptidase (penicillin-binding protein 4)